MSLFSEALKTGFSIIESVGSEEVAYVFDNTRHEGITAVPGRREGEIQQVSGPMMVETHVFDFLIRVETLTALNIIPKRGNKIVRKDGREYNVMPVGGGPPFKYSDESEVYYRIHTVRLKK